MAPQTSQFFSLEKNAEGVIIDAGGGMGNRSRIALKVEDMLPYWPPYELEFDKVQVDVVPFHDNLKSLIIHLKGKCNSFGFPFIS